MAQAQRQQIQAVPIEQLLDDPDFQRLSESDQLSVLSQLSAEFRAIPASEQPRVLRELLSQRSAAAFTLQTRTQQELDTKLRSGLLKTLEFAEDIAFPAIGAAVGGLAGAPLGPAAAIGAGALGAGGGEALKQLVRRATGRTAPTTSEEAAREIGLAMLGGAVQEAVPALRGLAKPITIEPKITPAMRTAEELGVRITPGQAGLSPLRAATENILERTLGGAETFKKFKITQAKQLAAGFDAFLDDISTARLTPQEAGTALQSALNTARRMAGEAIGDVERRIVEVLPNLQVPIKGEISSAASELLKELAGPTRKFTALRSFGDLNKAINILKQFAKPGRSKRTISELIQLKRLLDDAANFGELASQGESALRRLSGVIREEILNSVSAAGAPGLAAELAAANRRFGQIVSQLESNALKTLLRKDRPEVVLEFILQKGSQTTVERLLDIIGEEQFRPIARAAIEKIFTEATSEGVPISQKFVRLVDRVGDETLAKLLGGRTELQRFNRIVQLIDNLGLTTELTVPGSRAAGLGLLQGGLGGAVAGAIAGNPLLLLSSAAFSGAVFFGPKLLAQFLTRPGGAATIERALNQALRRGGRAAALRELAGILASEATKASARQLRVTPEGDVVLDLNPQR